jgi:excinuclease ABC subunit C
MARKPPLVTSQEALANLFAHSRYLPLLGSAQAIPLQGTKAEIRAHVRQVCPQLPGVYGMLNSSHQLLYVGMSRRLDRRLLTYFSSRVSLRKEGRIGRKARQLVWQPAGHPLIAWLRERELIQSFRPEMNVQGHPTGMQLGYLVQVDAPAPYFVLQDKLPRNHAGVWGPIPITRHSRGAVEQLNHHFQLRDCPRQTRMRFVDNLELSPADDPTPCLRADLQNCMAPCIGGCRAGQYQRAVRAARAFLDGRSQACLEEVQAAMQQAAQSHRFEQAARNRNRLFALQRLDLHLRRFHEWASHANFVYQGASQLDGQTWWMVVLRGQIVQIVPVPACETSRQAASEILQSALKSLAGRGQRSTVTGAHEFDAARTLLRWFRRHPDEQTCRCSLKAARRKCRR